MNWEVAFRSAKLGVAIGTAIGLIPLVVGLLCKKRRKAIVGFLACILGGAVGGLYAAIAIMIATTAQFVRPQTEVQKPRNEWSKFATLSDKIWYVLAAVWLLICMVAFMLISALFIIPLALGIPNSAPRDQIGKIVEPILLFGGMGLGIAVGFIGVSFISRKFISSGSHKNLAESFELSTLNRSPLLQSIAFIYYKCLLPHDWPLLKNANQKFNSGR